MTIQSPRLPIVQVPIMPGSMDELSRVLVSFAHLAKETEQLRSTSAAIQCFTLMQLTNQALSDYISVNRALYAPHIGPIINPVDLNPEKPNNNDDDDNESQPD